MVVDCELMDVWLYCIDIHNLYQLLVIKILQTVTKKTADNKLKTPEKDTSRAAKIRALATVLNTNRST